MKKNQNQTLHLRKSLEKEKSNLKQPRYLLGECTIEYETPVHRPVLLKEFLEHTLFCESRKELTIWDGTVGLGGHLTAFLEKYPIATSYGSDCDPEMLRHCQTRLNEYTHDIDISITQGNYSENPFQGDAPFDVILLDLGISSLHLDYFERGISYKKNELLDMRLNQDSGEPVFAWLMKAREHEIADVLFHYGEEYLARRIAREIISERKKQIIQYMDELKKICVRVYARAGLLNRKRHTTRHPYIKTLQAFRIHINDELNHLEKSMISLPYSLKQGGRLFVITFHSLEDRIVKRAFQKLQNPEDQEVIFRTLTKKPIKVSEEEIQENTRSRSAKMRIIEKIR